MPLLRWSNPGHDTRRASSLVRGAGCREINLRIRRREKNVLDIPFYRSGEQCFRLGYSAGGVQTVCETLGFEASIRRPEGGAYACWPRIDPDAPSGTTQKHKAGASDTTVAGDLKTPIRHGRAKISKRAAPSVTRKMPLLTDGATQGIYHNQALSLVMGPG